MRRFAAVLGLTVAVAVAAPAVARASGPPLALLSVTPVPAACGVPVTFNGSGSVASPPAVLVVWIFSTGDGRTIVSSGPVTAAAYFSIGQFNASLVVQDNFGLASAPFFAPVAVVNRMPVANLALQSRVASDQPFTAFATASLDPDFLCGDEIVTYIWRIDGGTPIETTEPDLDVGPLAPGSHSVILQVRDGFGAVSLPDTDEIISVARPTAVLDVPATAFCNQPVTLSGARSVAFSPSELVEYAFDLGDGRVVASPTSTTTQSYASLGSKRVSLVVTDDLGQESSPALADVLVQSRAPTAVLDAPPYVASGATALLRGNRSLDPDAACGDSIVRYTWRVDGGSPVNTTEPQLTIGPLPLGPHTVSLTVRDSTGNDSSTVARQIVWVGRPTAVLDLPASTTCGAFVTLSGDRSTAFAPARLVEYRFDLGDGRVVATADPSYAAGYSTLGPQQVSLVVVDDLGQQSTPALASLLVAGRSPTAALTGPATVAYGSGFTMSAAGSVDPDTACGDSIVEYRWQVDGGGAVVTTSPSRTFGALPLGQHTVTLVVRDSTGSLSTPTSFLVRVADLSPPVIAAKADVIVEVKMATTSTVVVRYSNPTASDNVDASVTVTCKAASGSSFGYGKWPIKCSAADAAGNTATSGFNVVVRLPTTAGAVTNPGNLDAPVAAAGPGRAVRVTAGGYDPGTTVVLEFLTAAGEPVPLGTAVAGADGRIDFRTKVPASAPPGDSQFLASATLADAGEFVRAWRLVVRESDG